MHIRGSGNSGQAPIEALRDGIVCGRVRQRPHHLEVNRRGQPEVERLPHDVGRLEEKCELRKLLPQARAQVANVVPRGMVLLVQRYQDLAVKLPDRSRIAVREVLAAVGESDVVENVRQLVFRDDLADRVFHLREINLGLLDACAGGRAHVQADLARVYLREEIGADERIQRHARGADLLRLGLTVLEIGRMRGGGAERQRGDQQRTRRGAHFSAVLVGF